jgi:hypothetical protein
VGLIGNRYLHSDLFLQKDVAPAIGKTKILKVINTMGKAIVLFEYVFRYYFQQLQYEIVWVKANIDKTQRKTSSCPGLGQ